MTLPSGTRLGPYEILSPLGAGGMGQVYRARDTRLDRTVAIKVLPPHLADRPELRQRLEREAKAISSLNHPHICVLHDIGNQEGADFLVMEYLEGETLAKRLEKGPLPPEQVLRYGIEIADALDKAHRQGVTHRDLKPGNIMLIPRSGTKLLDFGLAKAKPAPSVSSLTAGPTESSPLTAEGTVVGTFQYMSPEQFEGKEADARSDIFAFGAVLYEMMTGHKAFEGKTQASVIAAILEREPAPLSQLAPMAPPALERVVKTCLAKDPEERWQTAHDVKVQLQWIAEGGTSSVLGAGVPAPVAARRKSRELWAWTAAGVFFAVALALGILHFREAPPDVHAVRFPVAAPEKSSLGSSLAVSPDGRRLAFVATAEGKTLLWVRALDSLEAQPLAGTEGAGFPFWSPDSRSLGFFAEGKLKTVGASGGPTQTLANAGDARGGTWNRAGLIVYAPDITAPLYRVPAAGGTPEPATELDKTRHESSHRFPYFLPDNRHFLFWGRSTDKDSNAVFVGAVDSKERTLLFRGDSSIAYAPAVPGSDQGYVLFVREGTLMAQPFDARRLRLSGEPFPVAQKVGRYGESGPTGYSPFSVSGNGVLAYGSAGGSNTQLVWVDRSGKSLNALGPPGDYGEPWLSPDQKRVAVDHTASSGADIWLLEFSRGVLSRFTFHPAVEVAALWSPDGSRIVFASSRNGPFDLYQKLSSGAGEDELLFKSSQNKFPEDWSPDGRWIIFDVQGSKTRYDLWLLPLFGERKPEAFLETEFNETHAHFSPDGHWVAYASDESGGPEVYVRPFPSSGGKWQVSGGGGTEPFWRRDGKELFYIAPDRKLMSVPVKLGSTFEAGAPQVLFETRVPPGTMTDFRDRYVAAADGRRFLLNNMVETAASSPFTVVVNWAAEVRK